MTRQEKIFRIWLAGFFDGEGSIGVYQEQCRWIVRVSLYQKVESIIREIQERLGGYAHLNRHSDCWSLVWTHRKAFKVIEYLYPYLRVKKEQAKVLLDGRKLYVGGPGWTGRGRFLPEDLVAARKKLANSVNAFNAKVKPSRDSEAH